MRGRRRVGCGGRIGHHKVSVFHPKQGVADYPWFPEPVDAVMRKELRVLFRDSGEVVPEIGGLQLGPVPRDHMVDLADISRAVVQQLLRRCKNAVFGLCICNERYFKRIYLILE